MVCSAQQAEHDLCLAAEKEEGEEEAYQRHIKKS